MLHEFKYDFSLTVCILSFTMQITPQRTIPIETSLPLSSIHTSHNGLYSLASAPDRVLLLDNSRGKIVKTIMSKKYGASNAIFTLRQSLSSSKSTLPTSCIVSSCSINNDLSISSHALRLLDISTDSFQRYFNGHKGQIISLLPSNNSLFGMDLFYSSSIDGTVKSWDSRIGNPLNSLSTNCSIPVIELDTSGTLLALYNNFTKTISILPLETFPKSIISEFSIPNLHQNEIVESLKWLSNGLLIINGKYTKLILNTFNGTIHTLNFQSNIEIISDDLFRSSSIDVSPNEDIVFLSDNGIISWDISTISISSTISKKIEPKFHQLLSSRIISTNPIQSSIITADNDITYSIIDY